jgi:hypothetical protein
MTSPTTSGSMQRGSASRGEVVRERLCPIEEYDPQASRREAAMFYGLFLRGHSADTLRRDIDVPRKLHDKLLKRHRHEIGVQARLNRAYMYRKQVLAIFDELITRERIKERVH